MSIIGLTVGRNFTGMIPTNYGDKEWFKNGKRHREDGPAIEWRVGSKEWFIDGVRYEIYDLEEMFISALFLETKKGKYNLYWLKFLTKDQGIKEFPVIPGMEDVSPLLKTRMDEIISP